MLQIPIQMKKLFNVLLLVILLASTAKAEETKTVLPADKVTNYALYPASTGVFLRLDTRTGTINAIVSSNPKKSRLLVTDPLVPATARHPGRFELHPTDTPWQYLLFDTDTGQLWLLNWTDKTTPLKKIPELE